MLVLGDNLILHSTAGSQTRESFLSPSFLILPPAGPVKLTSEDFGSIPFPPRPRLAV